MSIQLAYSSNQAAKFPRAAEVRCSWMEGSKDSAREADELRATGVALCFSRDQEIYGEGDAADLFFNVARGLVRTCKFLSDGRRQIEAFHGPGDAFGLEAKDEYSLSAEAVSDCTLISYRRRDIAKLAIADQILAQQLLSQAMRSLARAQDHALVLGRRSALEKVAAFLIEWAHGAPQGRPFALAMTRLDIADYLNLTIETVSRTLSQLERDCVIEIPTARQIRIKDSVALRALNA